MVIIEVAKKQDDIAKENAKVFDNEVESIEEPIVTPAKKKTKNYYDDFIKSPKGEHFPITTDSAGADTCNCSLNNITPECAIHLNWRRKFDEFIEENK